jgi:hypothetical protein
VLTRAGTFLDRANTQSIAVLALDSLVVRECAQWCTVERWAERRWQHYDEVLVHHRGSTPVLAPSREAAMRLAQHRQENDDGAIALAKQRRVTEASLGHRTGPEVEVATAARGCALQDA